MSKNAITGDALRSRPLSPEGEANWDLIFGTKADTMHSPKEANMTTPYCPDCGHQLDENDQVFGVWVCPSCDEVVPDLPDDPLELLLDDLPEAP